MSDTWTLASAINNEKVITLVIAMMYVYVIMAMMLLFHLSK
jgi:hypothetical protein